MKDLFLILFALSCFAGGIALTLAYSGVNADTLVGVGLFSVLAILVVVGYFSSTKEESVNVRR